MSGVYTQTRLVYLLCVLPLNSSFVDVDYNTACSAVTRLSLLLGKVFFSCLVISKELCVGLGGIPIFSNLTVFFLLLNGIYHCFSNTEL